MTRLSSSSLIDSAWGTAAFTAGLVAFTAVGAFFSDAQGDRTGGVRFGVLLGLGLLAAALARLRRGPIIWILFGMAVGQITVGFLLLAQSIGAPRVVVTMSAIFATGWAVAAFLMLAAERRAKDTTEGTGTGRQVM